MREIKNGEMDKLESNLAITENILATLNNSRNLNNSELSPNSHLQTFNEQLDKVNVPSLSGANVQQLKPKRKKSGYVTPNETGSVIVLQPGSVAPINIDQLNKDLGNNLITFRDEDRDALN